MSTSIQPIAAPASTLATTPLSKAQENHAEIKDSYNATDKGGFQTKTNTHATTAQTKTAQAKTDVELNKESTPLSALPIPETRKVGFVENLHGHLISDPYRWLVLPKTPQESMIPHQAHAIKTWIDAQNARTMQAINPNSPTYQWLQNRYYELRDNPVNQPPFAIKGLGVLQWRQNGAADSKKLYIDRYRDTLKPEKKAKASEAKDQLKIFTDEALEDAVRVAGEVLIDELAIAKELGLPPSSHIARSIFAPDGKHLLLEFSLYSGDDRRVIAIVDTQEGKPVGETLTHVKFSQTQWFGNDHILYHKTQLTEQELGANAPDSNVRIMKHKVGTPQEADQKFFQVQNEPFTAESMTVGSGRLFYTRYNSKTGHQHIQSMRYDPKKIENKEAYLPDMSKLSTIHNSAQMIDGYGLIDSSRYLFSTFFDDAGNPTQGKLCTFDLFDAEKKVTTLVDVAPGKQLEEYTIAGEHLIAKYQVNLGHRLTLFDLEGNALREIDPEEHGYPKGSIHGVRPTQDGAITFGFSTPSMAPMRLKADLKTGKVTTVRTQKLGFDLEDFRIEETSYRSKDGTEIPMRILRKKGVDASQPQPTLLYGYGGFNIDIAHTTGLSQRFIPFLEAGGTLAMPALRGGSELGVHWHHNGNRLDKQNVFDDFIGAAETLIERGITDSDKLAIMGGSNGGLLVGATITQRPELFKAAIPHAGVLDMLRFDEYSAGHWWVQEYGNPKNKEDFENLLKYSPYHNVKPANYPATLVTTGLFDSRVAPEHSTLFTARLQEHQQGDAPIFCFVNPDSGHWANYHAQRYSEFMALQMSFLMQQIGLPAPQSEETPA